MSGLRILGAVMIALSGLAGAYMLNVNAKQGLSQTEAFISLLRYIRSEIECYSMPIPRALARCPKEILAGCGYAEKGAADSFLGLLDKCKINDSATEKILRSLADGIGKGYRDEQLALCDNYISRLDERRRSLASELPMRKKMNSALCVSGALAIVILLI